MLLLSEAHVAWSLPTRRAVCNEPCRQVTHWICPARKDLPEGDSRTHHLVPRPAAGGAREMRCKHCDVPERRLRADLETSGS